MFKKLKYIPLTLALTLSLTTLSAEDTAPTVDHLSVATMMIFDGKFDKAREELNEVDQSAANFDGSKYFTMLGVMDVKEKNTKILLVTLRKLLTQPP